MKIFKCVQEFYEVTLAKINSLLKMLSLRSYPIHDIKTDVQLMGLHTWPLAFEIDGLIISKLPHFF